MTSQIFDEKEWRVICEQCAIDAAKGSCLSETLFAQNLFTLIHSQLRNVLEFHHVTALKIAEEFGYLNAHELEEADKWNSKNGFCSHGIEMGCCPAGCDYD